MKVYAGFFKNTLDLYPADAYVVIDVLRFSTTISTALHLGTKEVIVYADFNEALRAARSKGGWVASEESVKTVIKLLRKDLSTARVIAALALASPKKREGGE